MSPIYEQCPKVFSCILEDALGILGWWGIAFSLLVWVSYFIVASLNPPHKFEEPSRLVLLVKTALGGLSLVAIFAVLFVAFGYSPYKRYAALQNDALGIDQAYKEVNERIKQKDENIKALTQKVKEKQRRIVDLVQKFPPPNINPEKREILEESLREISGSQRVRIIYLDEPTSRANVFARLLVNLFKSAGWTVRLNKVKKGYVVDRGIAVRRASNAPRTSDEQRAVIRVFRQAGLRFSTIIREVEINDRIEIEVGEM